MAVLTVEQRRAVWKDLMKQLSSRLEPVEINKDDFLAAVGALDDYMEANAGAINSAIPQPARSDLTTAQKAEILAYVTLKRYGG